MITAPRLKTTSAKPTVGLLLRDAFYLPMGNIRGFLLVGGLLVLFAKMLNAGARLAPTYMDGLSYSTLEWPVFLIKTFLYAQFAFYVHRYVLFGNRSFSVSLGTVFWRFFIAVLAIKLVFIIPDEILGHFYSRLAVAMPGGGLPLIARVFLEIGVSSVLGILILFLVAAFLLLPVHIIGASSVGFRRAMEIGKAQYWKIVLGMLFFHVGINIYGFFVGLYGGILTHKFIEFSVTDFTTASMVIQNLLFVPLQFLVVLLWATFTAAVYLRGASYLEIDLNGASE